MGMVIFIFGMIVASFINAVVYRRFGGFALHDLLIKPSHCEVCKKKLRWFDLIPVISFILSRGKCSLCGKRILYYYPISEAFLGFSFLLFYLFEASLISYFLLIILFSLSYWDFKAKSIPKFDTDILFLLSLIPLLLRIKMGGQYVLYEVILVIFLFVSVVILNRRKEKIGIGDIIVLSSVTLIMGFQIGVATLIYTILIGGIYAVVLVAIDRRNRKRYIPILPLITIGYVLGVIYPSVLNLFGL